MSDFVLKYNKNLWYGVFTHFIKAGMIHGISTRLRGKSDSPFLSLNLALHTGDDSLTVIDNRRAFCDSVGVDCKRLVTSQQVHDDQVVTVDERYAGRGALAYEDSIKHTDALITNRPNLPLMLCFADCVPVLIADPVLRVIGIAHAGWKGTVLKIAQKTVLKMQAQFGSEPADCLIGIGPSIGGCCYEVDEPVIRQFTAAFSYADEFITPRGEKWQLDLWEANRRQLTDIGVLPQNIVVSGVCTACNHELFYSYRQENGKTGRIAACISL